MKFAKEKAYGKINIGLNIKGVENGYHTLETVMAEINFYDVISVSTRRDNRINLTVKGEGEFYVSPLDNNVFKTAKLFAEKYQTKGADIVLQKNIPVGSGLGGSSADIVGTARAMARAYGIDEDLTDFVNSLCSDGEFLLKGGCALIRGKGKVVEKLIPKAALYVVIVIPETEFSTKEVFSEFGNGNYPPDKLNIDEIKRFITDGILPQGKVAFNALCEPACKLNGEIARAIDEMSALSPIISGMSGSGSSVYGIFETLELCLWAKGCLERSWERVVVKETLIKK